MSEREKASTPKEKDMTDDEEKAVPAFLPSARQGGDEDVLRLMRAL
ncbi:MAG: hypothetical protein U1E67_03345 [Hyphomicrobiales bacterium]